MYKFVNVQIIFICGGGGVTFKKVSTQYSLLLFYTAQFYDAIITVINMYQLNKLLFPNTVYVHLDYI